VKASRLPAALVLLAGAAAAPAQDAGGVDAPTAAERRLATHVDALEARLTALAARLAEQRRALAAIRDGLVALRPDGGALAVRAAAERAAEAEGGELTSVGERAALVVDLELPGTALRDVAALRDRLADDATVDGVHAEPVRIDHDADAGRGATAATLRCGLVSPAAAEAARAAVAEAVSELGGAIRSVETAEVVALGFVLPGGDPDAAARIREALAALPGVVGLDGDPVEPAVGDSARPDGGLRFEARVVLAGGSPPAIEVPPAEETPAAAAAREVAALERAVRRLREDLGPEHPQVTALARRLEAARARLEELRAGR